VAVYSTDLRARVIEAYQRGDGSHAELAKRFDISAATVRAWCRRFRKVGTITPLPRGKGPARRITEEDRAYIAQIALERKDATLKELSETLYDQRGVRASAWSIMHILREKGITRKKFTWHAAERETPERRAKIQEYEQTLATIDPHDLVFLDETGVNQAMAREYGRAPKGKRVFGSRPRKRGKNITIVGALDAAGNLLMATLGRSLNGFIFLGFLAAYLIPTLRRGQVIIMDNLKAHHIPMVRKLIEDAGCRLIYLPSYSPEYNPIEHCWSKLKAILRG
jgi:transposase